MKRFSKQHTEVKRIVGKATENIMNTITLIFTGGKSVNVQNSASSELREVKIVAPYGIASSGKSGMRAAILYDGDKPYLVGVYDPNKPNIEPGVVKIYNEFGCEIEMTKTGEIKMSTSSSTLELKSDGLYINGIKLESIIDNRIP